jgi:hypothetical protein
LTITSGKKRIARGSSTIRTRLNPSTRNTTHLKKVEVTAHTSIMDISARGMATTTIVISPMEDSRETIPMVITMETMVDTMGVMGTTMETTANTVTTQGTIGTCPTSHASSVGRQDTMLISAQRKILMKLPKPTHSRRDRQTTSMWRK